MYKTDNMHVLFGYSLTYTHAPANDSSQVLPLARFLDCAALQKIILCRRWNLVVMFCTSADLGDQIILLSV